MSEKQMPNFPLKEEEKNLETDMVMVRNIQPEDYDKVEDLIRRCITEVNAQDYSPAVTERMLATDPYSPRNAIDGREYFVAGDEDVAGVIGLKENEIKTFFVDPNYQGKGVGATLLSQIENRIREKGYLVAKLYSSKSARTFYERNGYVALREDLLPVGQENMLRFYMEKKFDV